MDLDQLNVKDALYTNETMRRLTSLGQEDMSDAARIAVFDYHLPVEDSETALEGAKNKEAVDDKATPTAQDPFDAL